MAAVAPGATTLRSGSGSTSTNGVAGETITPFQWLYIDASDSNKLKLAINTTAATAALVGVSLTYAATDEKVFYIPVAVGSQTNYIAASGATWTQGETYVVSNVAGQLWLAEDTATGDFVTIAGVAASTTSLMLLNTPTGLAAP